MLSGTSVGWRGRLLVLSTYLDLGRYAEPDSRDPQFMQPSDFKLVRYFVTHKTVTVVRNYSPKIYMNGT